MWHTLSMHQQFAKTVTVDGVRGHGENLFLGLLAGAVAAVIGAFFWMEITLATGWHGGYVALGVGALVGVAIRLVGNGTGMIFGIFGAILTLAGCLGGEILTVAQASTTAQHSLFSVLTTLDLTQLVPRIVDKMSPVMYLIYAIGIFEGYKLSIRK
jgi:hypothetical protein